MEVKQNNFRDAVLGTARRKSLSIREIARRMHIDHSQVSRPLNGKTSFRREWVINLCKALKCTPAEAAEIFAATDYRAPTTDELHSEDEEKPAMVA